MLDAAMATGSFRSAQAGAAGCKWADGWHAYLGAPEKACHPYATLLAASRLAGLPPALVLTAEDDPMRDESLLYAGRLRDSGVAVRTQTFPAPTQWPDALGRPAPTDGAWTAGLCAAFAAFLAVATPAPVASPALA